MTKVTSCETSRRPTDCLQHCIAYASGVRVQKTGTTAATEVTRIIFGNNSHERQNSRYCRRCICLFTCFHTCNKTWTTIVKFDFNSEAKSANERQDTPSNSACSPKIEIVICGAIQHSAQMKFPSVRVFAKVN